MATQPIGVGINENVVISKAYMNDKKKLVIELAPAPKEGKKVSVFDSMLTAGVQNESTNNLALQFMVPLLPKPKEGKEPQPEAKVIEMISNDFTKLKNQLTQILEQYILSEKIDLHTMEVMFANTGIVDGDTYEEKILAQDTINLIYNNLVERFLELFPAKDAANLPVRFKLLRQSKEKHFATIPSRFIADNPFIDHMAIPADQSKVKFSKWEMEQGLNDGTPMKPSDNAEKKGGDSGSSESNAQPVNPFAPQA
jgi:hypothetical protein